VLRSLAKQIEGVLKALPGTRDVAANREVMITSLPVRYRSRDLAAVGLSPAAAAEQVQDALQGETVAEVNEGIRRYAITVRLHPDERDSIDEVSSLVLRGVGGANVRLRDVADIGRERTSNLIARENGQRKAVISCNVADGYNLGQLVAAVKERVEPIVTKAGCTLTLGGQFEAQQSASQTILVMGGFVIVLMLLLLNAALGSLRAAVLVMVNLPLSLIGGIGAIYLTESANLWSNTLALFGLGSDRFIAPVISIPSMVGFITLFGIAVRNGILLVRHYFDLMHEGMPVTEAILRGSMERLVPILMTALTAALGLLPIVMAAGEPGSEILAPLSVVVLGGLLSSTFLNLLVVPAGFFLMFRNHRVGPSSVTPEELELS
jgi:HME family heavy-metal exporter